MTRKKYVKIMMSIYKGQRNVANKLADAVHKQGWSYEDGLFKTYLAVKYLSDMWRLNDS